MRKRAGRVTGIVVLALGMAGCDALLDVRNPGAILDEDLNDPRGFASMVRGASFELSNVLDEHAFLIARALDEMAGSGSYFSTGLFRRGILLPEDVDFYWNETHEARWTAEEVISRMTDAMGAAAESDTIFARAHLLAGIGNRLLGELMCETIYEQSGPLGRDSAFARALNQFGEAERLARVSGSGVLETAAVAGQAQALLGLAWAGRATLADAALVANEVPTDFRYFAFYDPADQWNVWWTETHGRHEASVFGTIVADMPSDNPRAPYTDCREGGCATDLGADGLTPHLRQEKFPEKGSDIPVITGVEMRMIEAEAALVAGDLTAFIDEINQARAFFGLPALAAPATRQEGFAILDEESFLNNWLEARRMWNLHRWDTDAHAVTMYDGSRAKEFVYGGSIVYPTEVSRRATCIPIPVSECQSNPNVTCS